MPTRLTWFRLTAALVIGVAFTALPRDAAYPLTLFAFLIAMGAGFVEDLLSRPAEEDEAGAQRPLQRAAQRALTLSALLALLLAEPDYAHLLAPPTMAVLLREFAAASIREATAGRGAVFRSARLGRWRARIEFLAVAALLAAGALPGVFVGEAAILGTALLWVGAALGLYEVAREYRAGLSFLRREAERAAAAAAAAAREAAQTTEKRPWARIPALRRTRKEQG